MIDEVMDYNRRFVETKEYEPFITDKYPNKKAAVLTCMDARLSHLLPAAMGIKNGDVKIIKNAGGVISGPFDSAVRSILIAIFELGVEEVLVIGHTDCGVQHMDTEELIEDMKKAGISQDHIDMMDYCGVDFYKWLEGFDDVETSVRKSVELLREHPLIPKAVRIEGFIMDSRTGEMVQV